MKKNLNRMEARKAPAQDVARHGRLFTSLGFMFSLALVVLAFEWKSYTNPIVDLRGTETRSDMEIVKIPITDLTPPKPVARPVVFVEKEKNEPESIDIPPIDLGDETPEDNFPLQPAEAPELTDDLPFRIVEEPASPAGGMETFYAFVANQLKGKYPPMARRLGIEGRVFVEFVVDRSGRLSDIRVVRGTAMNWRRK